MVLQACRNCGEPVKVREPTAAPAGDGGRMLVAGIVAFGMLLAGGAVGPAVFGIAKDALREGTHEVRTIPGNPFYSFDAQVDQCIASNPAPANDEFRTYEFPFDNRQWNWNLSLSSGVYNCLASNEIREGFGRFDYAQYVTARFDDHAMVEIVNQFRQVQKQEGYNERQLAAMVLSFVQHLEYAPDNVTTPYDEWPRFPLETLYAQGGDCEDSSILYASLIRAMGYDAVLLEPPGHMAVGLPVERSRERGIEYRGHFFAYAETTNGGHEIGDIPDVYAESSMRVWEL